MNCIICTNLKVQNFYYYKNVLPLECHGTLLALLLLLSERVERNIQQVERGYTVKCLKWSRRDWTLSFLEQPDSPAGTL